MARRIRQFLLPGPNGRPRVEDDTHVIVVGGGIAGIAAATVLAERGVRVTLLERERYIGGRAGAWTDRLATGVPFEMERGFHAFFRQYYNLKSLLRRIDPELEFLQPLADYPILGPHGQVQSFSGLPQRTPLNVIMLTARTPTLGLRDLGRVNARRALEMLTFDMDKTYKRRDQMSAKEYLDSLRFPPDARRLLFDVFSHSFFNPEAEMSAAELLMMFHFYFTGNPEGLIFDVARAPFSKSIWEPFILYLERLGVAIRTGESVRQVHRGNNGRWEVITDDERLGSDGVVLAVTVPALRNVLASSPDIDHQTWGKSIKTLSLTNPFAVWRLWLDKPTRSGRAPFVGTTGMGPIDNISLYHLFEDESRAWMEKHNGSVIELHAYAIDHDCDEATLRRQLTEALHALYPETKEARIIEERFIVGQDCPAFAPGSHIERPTVDTPFPGLTIAGDFVKLPIPSALMERAAASGFLAANHFLAGIGVRAEPISSISNRGILAGVPF
ncbi:MAG: FAD-dependent oxidoreductase [Candidatus Latescibacterota bacterium]|nr:MAG: FAD-dependent oxidoreductase [Candidatus Latescibacterota bacterium]